MCVGFVIVEGACDVAKLSYIVVATVAKVVAVGVVLVVVGVKNGKWILSLSV